MPSSHTTHIKIINQFKHKKQTFNIVISIEIQVIQNTLKTIFITSLAEFAGEAGLADAHESIDQVNASTVILAWIGRTLVDVYMQGKNGTVNEYSRLCGN